MADPCDVSGCDQPRHGGYLCAQHVSWLRKDLEAVPDLLADLEVTIARQDRIGDRTGGKSNECPLPLRPHAVLARDDLTGTLRHWLGRVTGQPGLGGPKQLAEALLVRLGPLKRHPEAGECAWEIGYVVRAARRAVDKPAERRYAGPCDACREDLYAKPRAVEIGCRGCGAVYDVQARRDWLLEQAEDRLLSAAEMSRALPGLLPPTKAGTPRKLTSSMIRGLAHRGRLTVYPPHPDKPREPRYQVGQVRALLEGMTERAAS